MGQILAIVSTKGGVGKTTTAVNLSAAFASLEFTTLLVEADPQCSLVSNFGFDRFDIPTGLSDVARRESELEETTFETRVPGLHMVSSNVWTQQEEADYVDALESDPRVLRDTMQALKQRYDYIIIDAPPMAGPITMAVLAAADSFIVPLQTEPQAARALPRLLEVVERVRGTCNPELAFDGVALTMVNSRTRMAAAVIEEIRKAFPDHVYSTFIPRSVKLAEIPASGRPLVVAAPASRGARAYSALAEEILSRHSRDRAAERASTETAEDMENVPELVAASTAERAGDTAVAEVRPEPAPANGQSETMPANGSQSSSSETGSNSSEEEGPDERFVDIDTYLKMESGEPAKTQNSDEEEWEENWGAWTRDD